MKPTILKIVCKLRKFFEKHLFDLFAPKNWEQLPDLDKWGRVRELLPENFSNEINKYPYQSDRIFGLFDCSHPVDKPQYFFKDLPYARDCDDWSRVWVAYYLYHGKEVQEWLVTNKNHPFTRSHFVAVVKEAEGYRLLNYYRYPATHPTPEEALDDLELWNGDTYSKENRLQCLYNVYKPE